MALPCFANPARFPLHRYRSSWLLTNSDYRDSAEQNAVGNTPFSIPATTDSTVFRSSFREAPAARDDDGVRKHPIPVGNPDTRPEQSDCYSMVFGVSSAAVSVLSVVVITTSPIQRIRSICSEVTALLSHYSCFCSFSVYPKDDYSFVLDNTYCDFCIASKSILSEVSYFYPDVLFSYVDDSSTDVRLWCCLNPSFVQTMMYSLFAYSTLFEPFPRIMHPIEI